MIVPIEGAVLFELYCSVKKVGAMIQLSPFNCFLNGSSLVKLKIEIILSYCLVKELSTSLLLYFKQEALLLACYHIPTM